MLLIPTNSVDGTSDAIAGILAELNQPFFRWNIDLWRHYEIHVDGQTFRIRDPLGRMIDAASSNVHLLWRKPFTDLMGFDDLPIDPADQQQARTHIGQWLQTIVALMRPARRVRLVEPYADRRLPKLYQLHVAQNFFDMPRSHFGIQGCPTNLGPMLVAKPLGDPSVGTDRIFYTRQVDGRLLFRPYPWFVQEPIIEGQDVTCVYIGGRSHFYICSFVRGNDAVDWRVEINTSLQSQWSRFTHPQLPTWEQAVQRFMARIGLHFGRLDFILQDDRLIFLECNSNGQFGWLDSDGMKLHREFVLAALGTAATVAP